MSTYETQNEHNEQLVAIALQRGEICKAHWKISSRLGFHGWDIFRGLNDQRRGHRRARQPAGSANIFRLLAGQPFECVRRILQKINFQVLNMWRTLGNTSENKQRALS